jgi:hypothetical protein
MTTASTMWILEQGLILRFEQKIGLTFIQNECKPKDGTLKEF